MSSSVFKTVNSYKIWGFNVGAIIIYGRFDTLKDNIDELHGSSLNTTTTNEHVSEVEYLIRVIN